MYDKGRWMMDEKVIIGKTGVSFYDDNDPFGLCLALVGR